MPYNESLAERVRLRLATATPFTERKMFGGVAFLVGGNMACGIVRDELMVRTGSAGYAHALARPHARPMDFTGRQMTGMVMVGADGLDDDSLDAWVQCGVGFASSLPPK